MEYFDAYKLLWKCPQRTIRLFACAVVSDYLKNVKAKSKEVAKAVELGIKIADDEIAYCDLEVELCRMHITGLLREDTVESFKNFLRWMSLSCIEKTVSSNELVHNIFQLKRRYGVLHDDDPYYECLIFSRRNKVDNQLINTMASDIYQRNAWDELPVLADAYEDAGYNDSAILGHLRECKRHWRGCWAVDLLAGMSRGVQ